MQVVEKEIIEFFASRNFENSRRFNYDYSPKNLKNALKYFGNPQEQFKTIHIAGTVGKGSMAHYLTRLLLQYQASKVGLYTSPHYLYLGERIQVNQQSISVIELEYLWRQIRSICLEYSLSYFDALTLMGFLHFAAVKVEWAVIETGLGGRLDSTNVLAPQFCVITQIGLDHTRILGPSIEKIALEKAGIIKKNTPVYLTSDNKKVQKIVMDHAEALDSPFFLVKASIDENSIYLQENWSLAQKIFSNFFKNTRVSDEPVVFDHLILPGRLEKIRLGGNYCLYDSAHNAAGIQTLTRSLAGIIRSEPIYFQDCITSDNPWVIITNILQEKSMAKFLLYWMNSAIQNRLAVEKIIIWDLHTGGFHKSEKLIAQNNLWRLIEEKFKIKIEIRQTDILKEYLQINSNQLKRNILISGSIYFYSELKKF